MEPSCTLYPIPYDYAWDLAEQVRLDLRHNHIEPSRLDGYIFNHPSAAIAFKLMFDARNWQTTDDEFFLMVAPRASEVAVWVGQSGYEFERVEITAIQFGSSADRTAFEDAL